MRLAAVRYCLAEGCQRGLLCLLAKEVGESSAGSNPAPSASGESSKGRTEDFGSSYLGSSPSSPVGFIRIKELWPTRNSKNGDKKTEKNGTNTKIIININNIKN